MAGVIALAVGLCIVVVPPIFWLSGLSALTYEGNGGPASRRTANVARYLPVPAFILLQIGAVVVAVTTRWYPYLLPPVAAGVGVLVALWVWWIAGVFGRHPRKFPSAP